MLQSGAADEGKLLFEGLTRTMNANSGVALLDSGFERKGLQTAFCKVHVTKYLGVGRLQCVEDVVDALADDFTSPLVVPRFGLQIFSPSFQRTIFGSSMAIVVDDTIAKDAVKPSDG